VKIPKIKWIPFDSNNPPANLNPDETFLIFLREDDYNNGASWHYSVDVASPYGDYLDNFWTTTHEKYLRTCTLMIGISGMTINHQRRFYIFAMADSARLVQMNVIIQLILTMPKTLIRNLAFM